MPTLNWVGKDEVLNHNPAYYTLEKKYTFNSKNNTSENMIIKGDNLLALKALLPQYENKIKCIYIDPPYNTGNENWVYNDNVNSPKIKKWLGEMVAKDDLSRHDKWLCMMLPRLKLLHRLLSDDGVIFISIDDKEQAHLRLLCDEVFGTENFITDIIWHKKDNASFLGGKIIKLTDHILMYQKSDDFLGTKDCEIDTNKHRELITKPSKISTRVFDKNFTIIENGKFTGTLKADLYGSEQFGMEILEDVEIENGIPKDNIKIKGKFCWSQETIDNEIKNGGRIEIKSIKGMKPVFYKNFGENIPFRPMRNLLSKKIEDNIATNNDAAEEIKDIFCGIPIFDYSKPSKLIFKLVSNITRNDKNSIILDSFAGSGTTAHAVLELNKKDGGNRKFILVEMEDYAENITAERVRRVIKGYGKEPENSATGGDFSFYELEDRLLLENGNLNEKVSIEKIREYIYFSETKEKCEQNNSDFLGECNGVAYYFIYKKDEITTLDFEYLVNLKKASSYVIYADVCVLSDETMMKYNITFKKIPRDIKKV